MNPSPGAEKKPAPELLLRTASALVMLVVTLGLTAAGGVWFAIFCAAGAALVAAEYSALTSAQARNWVRPASIAAIALVIVLYFAVSPTVAWLAACAAAVALAVGESMSGRAPWAAAGTVYASLPFFALAMLRGDGSEGLVAVLFVFGCVFAADTAAYFAGRAFGGPKLAPRISPNKTWSGFLGGVAGSAVVGLAILVAAGHGAGAGAAVAAMALSVVSQCGDLFESWVKRRFGKKDSGRIIPGHGGLLDRIDGLIFASAAAWIGGVALGGAPFAPGEPGRALIAAIVLP